MPSKHPDSPAVDRVGSGRLRAVTLPHHRTCGFPHPAVEPGSGINPLRPAMVMKPVALLPWSLHSAPLRCISSGAGLLPLGRFLLAGPLLYSPLPELSRKCALGSLLDCFGKLLAPLLPEFFQLVCLLVLWPFAPSGFHRLSSLLRPLLTPARALARQISPSKVSNVSTRVVGLYLLQVKYLRSSPRVRLVRLRGTGQMFQSDSSPSS
jgi:hypothetical protein